MEQQQEKLSDELALKRTGLADTRTGLAFKRNIMAAERTLMAWTRTGLSMIGFGFTIYKFLQALQDEGNQLNVHPARIGLFLLFLGTFSLLAGATQYWSILLALLGLLLIVSIIGRVNIF